MSEKSSLALADSTIQQGGVLSICMKSERTDKLIFSNWV
jgi:hypothetical protein